MKKTCSLDECDSSAYCRGWCSKHYQRWQRTGTTAGYLPALDRYWSKVDQTSTPDGCWLWTGAPDKDGYGKFTVGYTTFRATRWGYEQIISPIADGLSVLHTCDTPACHRPEHWFLGTPIENMRDRDIKRRQAAGERHGMARLTWNQVHALRDERTHGATISSLAVRYGISKHHASAIVNNQSWKT